MAALGGRSERGTDWGCGEFVGCVWIGVVASEGMPMDFVFYPKHEHRCAHVGHCPHVGGASLGMLVLAANEQGQYLDMLHGQLDEERRRNTALVAENQSLREQLAQTQRELKTERQQRFCKDRPTAEKSA